MATTEREESKHSDEREVERETISKHKERKKKGEKERERGAFPWCLDLYRDT